MYMALNVLNEYNDFQMFHAMASEGAVIVMCDPNFWSRISRSSAYMQTFPFTTRLLWTTHIHTHTQFLLLPWHTVPAFSECRCTGWAGTILLIHILSSRKGEQSYPDLLALVMQSSSHIITVALGVKEFCGLQQCTQCAAEPGRVGVHHEYQASSSSMEILGWGPILAYGWSG